MGVEAFLKKHKYKKSCELGRGGNGVVYEVYKNNKAFALKFLKKGSGYSKKRFKREIEVLKKLKGIDGILEIIDYDMTVPCYTMPKAKPLFKWILEKEPSTFDIIKKFLDLAKTLKAAADLHCFHRDIKPDNLFIFKDRIFIGDFGLGKDLDCSELDITQDGHALGPYFFIAPEMRRTPSTADAAKADIYSLAKTLWAVLTKNKKSFDGQYDFWDNSIGLNFFSDLKEEYLVNIEILLYLSTSNTPRKRPNLEEFINCIETYCEEYTDVYKRQNRVWTFIEYELFKDLKLTTIKWTDKEEIVRVLNVINFRNAYNHMFLPIGGGMDFVRAELAAEKDCIALIDEAKVYHIVKPKYLLFEKVDNSTTLYDYFLLVCENIDRVSDEYFTDTYEELLDIGNGTYISSKDEVYGVVDYETGELLPDDYKSILRYFKGNILIVPKQGIYNKIFDAYDARHSYATTDEFNQYMLNIRDAVSTGKNASSVSANFIPDYSNLFPHDKKDKSEKLKAFIEEKWEDWDIGRLDLQHNTSSIAYYIGMKSYITPLKPLKIFLLWNGKFERIQEKLYEEILPTNLALMNIDDVVNIKSQLIKYLCQVASDIPRSEWEKIICIKSKINSKILLKTNRKEFYELLFNADDRFRQYLILDIDGKIKLIKDYATLWRYPIEFLQFSGRGNEIGKYSNKDMYYWYWAKVLAKYRSCFDPTYKYDYINIEYQPDKVIVDCESWLEEFIVGS